MLCPSAFVQHLPGGYALDGSSYDTDCQPSKAQRSPEKCSIQSWYADIHWLLQSLLLQVRSITKMKNPLEFGYSSGVEPLEQFQFPVWMVRLWKGLLYVSMQFQQTCVDVSGFGSRKMVQAVAVLLVLFVESKKGSDGSGFQLQLGFWGISEAQRACFIAKLAIRSALKRA